MAAGDAQRIWFKEIVDTLRSKWRREMPFEELIRLRDELDEMLQLIRSERQIRPYGGFTTGYNANISVKAGSSPTGFALDPAMYLNQPFPSLGYSLPDKNPADASFNATQTVSPDANRPGYVQNYNVSIQYLLPLQTVLETAFVGNHGTRLWGFNELDVTPSRNLALGDTLIEPVSSHPQYIPYAAFPTTNTVAKRSCLIRSTMASTSFTLTTRARITTLCR